jgi:hypothetical protein
VNNLCVPTQVAPEYGPGDKALVSVSVLGERADRADLTERVRDQLADWFGPGVHSWRHLRTYRIARALPRQEPGWLSPPLREARLGAGVYIAGDHRANASIDGALTSGRRAAEAVLEDRARNGLPDASGKVRLLQRTGTSSIRNRRGQSLPVTSS